ncbi:hypothetical protein B0I21_10552 [Sphingobacterium paludis]|uniref:Calcineurin-like phosphoesterase family protein n=1 Tax=Sphingobacterium paludis TaxID=1476465 RepID=A0A4R7CYU4_9SPHI|nr:hypothetical protein B0I21_10552 [Sphingobacterium paludis]
MKNSILFAALFLLINNAFGQRANTEVYIIGNIHDSVPNYNPTILLAIMNDIKPDIILHEVDRE